jgi:hypothetical protein
LPFTDQPADPVGRDDIHLGDDVPQLAAEGQHVLAAAEEVEMVAEPQLFVPVSGPEPEVLEAALHCAYQRHSDYLGLLDAFERRALIEQAKGLLMAEHRIESQPAFEMLRRHSQRTHRKLTDVAGELIHSHSLLLYPEVSRTRHQPDLVDALVPRVLEPDPNRVRGTPKRGRSS